MVMIGRILSKEVPAPVRVFGAKSQENPTEALAGQVRFTVPFHPLTCNRACVSAVPSLERIGSPEDQCKEKIRSRANVGQDCGRTAWCKLVVARETRIKSVRRSVAVVQGERRDARRRSQRCSDNLTVFYECNQTRRHTVLRIQSPVVRIVLELLRSLSAPVKRTYDGRRFEVDTVTVVGVFPAVNRGEDAVLIVDSEKCVCPHSERRCTEGGGSLIIE